VAFSLAEGIATSFVEKRYDCRRSERPGKRLPGPRYLTKAYLPERQERACPMSKLRHIAIIVRDPAESAKFFEQAST